MGKAEAVSSSLAATSLLVVASVAPLVDRDEPRYAQAVREMRTTGDLLVPRNFGQLRPDKPVLIYWLQLASTELFGENELGFRVPSLAVLAAWLWATARLAQTLRAQTCWALVPGLGLAGLFATPDALVGALTTASLLAFLRARSRPQASTVALAWVLFGLGLLAKGPVTPLFLLPPLFALCHQDRRLWRVFFPPWGPALALGLLGLWLLPANAATDGELVRRALGHHVVARALRPLEGHGLPGLLGVLMGPPFYLVSLALAAFPLLPAFWRSLRFRPAVQEHVNLALAGVAVPLVLLSLVQTKLPHYILPAVPLVVVLARPQAKGRLWACWATTLLAWLACYAALATPYRAAGKALASLPAPALAIGMHEPSLRFYAGDKLVLAPTFRPGFRYLLLRPGEEAALPTEAEEHLRRLSCFRGFNLAKARRETLYLYQLVESLGVYVNPGPGGSVAEMGTGLGRNLAAK